MGPSSGHARSLPLLALLIQRHDCITHALERGGAWGATSVDEKLTEDARRKDEWVGHKRLRSGPTFRDMWAQKDGDLTVIRDQGLRPPARVAISSHPV